MQSNNVLRVIILTPLWFKMLIIYSDYSFRQIIRIFIFSKIACNIRLHDFRYCRTVKSYNRSVAQDILQECQSKTSANDGDTNKSVALQINERAYSSLIGPRNVTGYFNSSTVF